jgi:NDP-hexose 4-ketoreductase
VATRAVVVLGSTGFAGRHLCDAFEDAGHRVVRVARGASGPDAVRLDLAEASEQRIAGLLAQAQADILVNAVGGVWGVSEHRMNVLNAELPAKLVRAVRTLPRTSRPRVVHLGSVHEYGAVPHGTAVTEELPPAPDGAYGRSKLLGTRALLEAAREGELNAVVLRLSNMLGPGAPAASLQGVVAGHLATAREEKAAGRPVPSLKLAPLLAHRDFVDVRDVAQAALAAAHTSQAGGRVLNIGRGQAVGVRELVHRMVAVSGLPVEVVEAGAGDDAGTARGSIDWQRLDISAASRVLAWRPRRDLNDTLRDLLAPSGHG